MVEQDFDKFHEFRLEKFPEQIRWKVDRAKQHLQDFERAAAAYMNQQPSGPGRLVLTAESTLGNPIYNYATPTPPPESLGLIAGDFLQNLRSVLDYLVWQLILANGKIPHETNTAFPVCKKPSSFNDAKERRLVGVPDEALSIIEAMQPYPEHQDQDRPQTINILDELTNENKHRHILFTSLATASKRVVPAPFPHIELEITRLGGDGQVVPDERILAYLVFQGGIVKGIEVTVVLAALLDWIGFDVLPRFEQFF